MVSDAFDSEMVRFADLVLPDTTYLERFDTISLLDRPISEPDTAGDAIRHPIIPLDRDVRPWQEVLVDLAARLKFPAFTLPDGEQQSSRATKTSLSASSVLRELVFWQAFAAPTAASHWSASPIRISGRPISITRVFLPITGRTARNTTGCINRDYLEVAARAGFVPKADPIIMQIYSEPLQKFRLAGLGQYAGPQPTREVDRQRLRDYFDPLPIWYPPLETARINAPEYRFHAITQRPMMMYHSWDSQNSWLRQILGQNFLYMNADTAAELKLKDFDWVWVESHNGRIRCQLKTMQGCERNTVWTWNAIGKMAGRLGPGQKRLGGNARFPAESPDQRKFAESGRRGRVR